MFLQQSNHLIDRTVCGSMAKMFRGIIPIPDPAGALAKLVMFSAWLYKRIPGSSCRWPACLWMCNATCFPLRFCVIERVTGMLHMNQRMMNGSF